MCSRSGSATRSARLEGERLDLAGTGAWIVDHGGVAYLAHPYWTGVTPGSLELPETVSGIEVFNAGCELEIGRGLSTVHWDELLETGRPCFALATDDSHHPGFDSDLAWTWVRAEPTADGVLDALRTGCFYATTGPRITTVTTGGGSVEVYCDPCQQRHGRVRHLERRRGARRPPRIPLRRRHPATTADGSITAARLNLPETAPYARVEVTNRHGTKAWTNPIWP